MEHRYDCEVVIITMYSSKHKKVADLALYLKSTTLNL